MALPKVDPSLTRQRLLEAAGEVFAEIGFESATVREISRRARANVAAVNYHFGDKMELYLAVLQYANVFAEENYPSSPPGPEATASIRLRAFVEAFLRKLFDDGRPSWHVRLMSREMIEPTGALPTIVEHAIRPQIAVLRAIILDLTGPLPEATLAWCQASVVGQILFYHHSRAVLNLLHPVHYRVAGRIEKMAEHITDFTLGGLKAVARKAPAPKKGRR